jgi:DNA-binding HxlR family transcriptional regulator
MNSKQFCPVAETANLVGRKWTLLIIYSLLKGGMRFNELKASLRGISSKTLSKELSTMVREGLVERKVNPGPPVTVRYSLTEMGRELEELIESMRSWGDKWLSNSRVR